MTTEKPIEPNGEDKQAIRIAWLIAGYIQNKLSQAEHFALDNWVTECAENQEMFERLTDETTWQYGLQQIKQTDTQAALHRVAKKIFPASGGKISGAPVLILFAGVFR